MADPASFLATKINEGATGIFDTSAIVFSKIGDGFKAG